MKRNEGRIILGLALLVVGFFSLLLEIGVFQANANYIVAVLFGAGGLAFLYVFLRNTQENWWAVIPGMALVGIGALIFITTIAPETGAIGGALFLGSLALAFWLIYFSHNEQWWAIIPAGVLSTIALVAGLSDTLNEGEWLGGIFFLGLGLTFALLSVVPTPEGHQKWALIPAGVLLLIGVVISIASASLAQYIWPFALILVGAYLIFRTLRK